MATLPPTRDWITFGEYDDQVRRKKQSMLDEIDRLIDYRPIEAMLNRMYRGSRGRPPIPPLMLFKALLLEQWYGLSDVEVVQEIHDRRSFERFVGHTVRDYLLDDSTLVRFRQRLRDFRYEKELFRELNRQLASLSLFVRSCTLVDATLVKGATGAGSTREDGTPVDPDVTVTVRKDQPIDGMKVHVSMDHGSELIEDVTLTSNNVHDSQVFEELLPEETGGVFADKAYDSAKHRKLIKTRKLYDGILHKAKRNKRLTEHERTRNRANSRLRSRIEAKMNDLKRWGHLARMRYYGIERNFLQVCFAAMAVNLKRACKLVLVT
jgi:transposase, IS5 family